MSVTIHGKEYKTVAERLNEIGKDLLGVDTQVLYLEPQIMVKATIKTTKGRFTGISAADPSKSIEAKTPVEVAETSAVGRALAFAGYAGSEIASADEMQKVFTSSPSATTASKPTENAIDTDLTTECRLHKVPMVQKISPRTGNPYWSHVHEGKLCFGDK